jgi:hypothetical protein
MRDSYL